MTPTSYDKSYFNRNIPETWFSQLGLLRPDQHAALCYVLDLPYWRSYRTKRDKKYKTILSIGCGLGDLEVKLESFGLNVLGYDPYYHKEYKGQKCLATYNGEQADILLFCESIEHLTKEQTKEIIDAQKGGTKIIIVNWPDFHPIPEEGFDHITRIDDDYFDWVLDGREPEVRKGSHLVFIK